MLLDVFSDMRLSYFLQEVKKFFFFFAGKVVLVEQVSHQRNAHQLTLSSLFLRGAEVLQCFEVEQLDMTSKSKGGASTFFTLLTRKKKNKF